MVPREGVGKGVLGGYREVGGRRFGGKKVKGGRREGVDGV